MIFFKRKNLFYIQNKKNIYSKKKIKNVKILKVNLKILFISRLKAIKNIKRFFLLFTNCISIYSILI